MKIISNIVDESEGWDGETIIELDNGQFYRQVEYFYHYNYSYRPKVIIENNRAKIAGIDKAVRVELIQVVKSRLIDESEGWDGETILRLENGQVWKQVQYYYKYQYKSRPKVVIIVSDSKAMIQGISKAVKVERVS